MNLVNEVKQGKGIDLASPGCRPADIDTSRSSLFTEEDRATGEGFKVTGTSVMALSLFICRRYYQEGKGGVNGITSIHKK
jgi:hypothetical protein